MMAKGSEGLSKGLATTDVQTHRENFSARKFNSESSISSSTELNSAERGSEPRPPGRREAMEAMCHRCTGRYQDGLKDCGDVACPLYYWFRYRKSEPNYSWRRWNPRRIGLVRRKRKEDQNA